ncbi:MAG: 30S ribosomal protein S8 [Deltaproteobacteria bacterium]|nr:30S ribosomal protein S8 [Deltaproteobacteria bacterium]
MAMTDPIADMLTRVRNAQCARKKDVIIPASKVKTEILGILKEEGYVGNITVVKEDSKSKLKVELKYGPDNKGVIAEVKRLSKPGRRLYVKSDAIPDIVNGLGVAIVSTSKGVMSDKKARELGLGGELICSVY